jgi:hypothetical protein
MRLATCSTISELGAVGLRHHPSAKSRKLASDMVEVWIGVEAELLTNSDHIEFRRNLRSSEVPIGAHPDPGVESITRNKTKQ